MGMRIFLETVNVNTLPPTRFFRGLLNVVPRNKVNDRSVIIFFRAEYCKNTFRENNSDGTEDVIHVNFNFRRKFADHR